MVVGGEATDCVRWFADPAISSQDSDGTRVESLNWESPRGSPSTISSVARSEVLTARRR